MAPSIVTSSRRTLCIAQKPTSSSKSTAGLCYFKARSALLNHQNGRQLPSPAAARQQPLDPSNGGLRRKERQAPGARAETYQSRPAHACLARQAKPCQLDILFRPRSSTNPAATPIDSPPARARRSFSSPCVRTEVQTPKPSPLKLKAQSGGGGPKRDNTFRSCCWVN